MKRLLVYLKSYKKECFLAPAFKMLEAIFELLVPLVVVGIIDIGIANGDKGYILRSCLIMGLLGAVGLASAVTAQYFSARAAVGFATEVRRDLFTHIMKLSYKQIDETGTSTLITRITADVNQAQTGVNMFLRLFLRSPFIVFGAMIMAFSINPSIALIFVIVIVALFAVVGGVMYFNIPMLRKVQKRLDVIMLLTRENLVGARVIRAFRMEEKEIDSYLLANQELVVKQLNAGHLSALLNPVTYIIVNLAIVILIYAGAVKVNTGMLTQGQVVALYNYMSQILVELIKLANLILVLNKAIASGGRIAEVMETSIEDIDNKFDSANNLTKSETNTYDKDECIAVSFKNVSLKYNETGDEALSDISFDILDGKTLGIIGGTGSGKSSVINLIPRFYDATAGVVSVFGKDVRSVDRDELRSIIGMVPQKTALFKGTIADNLRLGNETATDEELMDAVRGAIAEDIVNKKGGLLAMIEQNGRNLSGGQRQRLTIARALVKKPRILILDDSSSALDYATEKKLKEKMYSLDYKPTVIIVSQRASSVLNADKIVVLDDGEIVGVGTHGELVNSCEVYREIYESQYGKI